MTSLYRNLEAIPIFVQDRGYTTPDQPSEARRFTYAPESNKDLSDEFNERSFPMIRGSFYDPSKSQTDKHNGKAK